MNTTENDIPVMAATKAGIALGLALLVCAAPATATSNVNDPFSYAFAASLGFPESVSTSITNGVQGTTNGMGSGSGSALATSSDGGFKNSAGATSNTGGTSGATGNLRAGAVAAYATNGTGGNSRSSSEARIKDTVFFTNSSGGTLFLPFSFSFDGSISDPDDFGATASSILSLSGALRACSDGSYSCGFGDYSMSLQNGGTPNMTTVIGYAANGSQNGVQQGGAFFFNAPDNVDLVNYSVVKDWDSGGGYYNTVVSSVLAVPAGASRIGFDLRIILDCWVYPGAVCNFSDTSKFGFGALPDGLSFTSASGVFLARATPTPGGVPEPATWALLIAGFGLVGTAMRRRRIASVSA